MSSTNINNKVQRNVAYGGNTVKAMYYGDDLVWERANVTLYAIHEGDTEIVQNCWLSTRRVEWVEDLGRYYTIGFLAFEMIWDETLLTDLNKRSINKFWSADGISWTRERQEWEPWTYPYLSDWKYSSPHRVFLWLDSVGGLYKSGYAGEFRLIKQADDDVGGVVGSICSGGSYTYVFYGSKYIYSDSLGSWSSGNLDGSFSYGSYMRTMSVPDGVMVSGNSNLYYINDTGKILTPIVGDGIPLIGGIYVPSINGGVIYVWDGSYRYTYDATTNSVTETVASVLECDNLQPNNMSYSTTLGVFIYKHKTNIYTSLDGITWTRLTPIAEHNMGYTIREGTNRYVSAVGAYMILN